MILELYALAFFFFFPFMVSGACPFFFFFHLLFLFAWLRWHCVIYYSFHVSSSFCHCVYLGLETCNTMGDHVIPFRWSKPSHLCNTLREMVSATSAQAHTHWVSIISCTCSQHHIGTHPTNSLLLIVPEFPRGWVFPSIQKKEWWKVLLHPKPSGDLLLMQRAVGSRPQPPQTPCPHPRALVWEARAAVAAHGPEFTGGSHSMRLSVSFQPFPLSNWSLAEIYF